MSNEYLHKYNTIKIKISGSGSNTEGLSKLVTHYINPVNRRQPSYLEDTRHILEVIKEVNQTMSPLPPTTRIVTMDVVAMYPSIPPREGVAAMKQGLLDEGMPRDLVDFVVEATELVLNCNVYPRRDSLVQHLWKIGF